MVDLPNLRIHPLFAFVQMCMTWKATILKEEYEKRGEVYERWEETKLENREWFIRNRRKRLKEEVLEVQRPIYKGSKRKAAGKAVARRSKM